MAWNWVWWCGLQVLLRVNATHPKHVPCMKKLSRDREECWLNDEWRWWWWHVVTIVVIVQKSFTYTNGLLPWCHTTQHITHARTWLVHHMALWMERRQTTTTHLVWLKRGKQRRKGAKRYLVPPRFELRSRDPESPILTLILWGLHMNSILFSHYSSSFPFHSSLTSFSFSSHWRHSEPHHSEQHVTATNRDSRLFPFCVFVYDSESFHSNLKPLFSQMHLPLLEGRLLHSKTVNTWCHSQRAFNQQQGKALQSNYIIGIAFESFPIHSHSTSNKKHNNTLSVSLGNRHGMQLY